MTLWRALIIVGMSMGFAFSVLIFGSSQWNRYINVFQNSYMPFGWAHPPEGYTGQWLSYDDDFNLHRVENFKGGAYHGQVISYQSPNVWSSVATYDEGALNIRMIRESSGAIQVISIGKDGKEVVVYEPMNNIDRRAEFGVPVK